MYFHAEKKEGVKKKKSLHHFVFLNSLPVFFPLTVHLSMFRSSYASLLLLPFLKPLTMRAQIMQLVGEMVLLLY